MLSSRTAYILLTYLHKVKMKNMKYKQPDKYLDIEQSLFVWHVADSGYEITEAAQPIFAEKHLEKFKGPYLVEKREASGYYTIKPLEDEPTLFLKFAETPPTNEGILAFASKYGFLGEHQDIFETKDFWLHSIRKMRNLTTIWQAVETKDSEALKRFFLWTEDLKRVRYCIHETEHDAREVLENALSLMLDKEEPIEIERGVIADSERFDPLIFKRFKPGDLVLPAKCFLQQNINKGLEKYPLLPILLLNEKNELIPYLYPSSLLSAMYLQFFRAVAGERKYKRCAICGRWEDATDKKATWNKHRTCANREYVRKHREKHKITSAKQVQQSDNQQE